MTQPKTLLVFPPQWSPQNPFYAQASLAGHLRSKGFPVEIFDLNMEFYDRILSPEYLQYIENRLILDAEYLKTQTIFRNFSNDRSKTYLIEGMRLLEIEKYFKEHPGRIRELAGAIQEAKDILRNRETYYDPENLVWAFSVIDQALEAISLPFYPAKLSFNDFSQQDTPFNIESLTKLSQDRSNNLFYEVLDRFMPTILLSGADFISISINSFSQVLAGLTLASMVRKHMPQAVIGIGGNFFARVGDTLAEKPRFFESFCDVLSLGEGEAQLVELLQAIRAGEDFRGVSNIIYRDAFGELHRTENRPPARMDSLGVQDLEGFPLEKYFSPETVCSIQASKGCYWGKCSFCDTDYGVRKDSKSLKRLVDEIRYLKENYGVRHFQFIDEAIPPERMEKMADLFLEADLGIQWFCNGRLETGFTEERLEKLHSAGLRMVLWGFESGSTRIMKLINKGIDIDRRIEVLRHSAEAGIWNFAYIFFGFPTETKEEAQMTIDALSRNRDIIHSYGRSVFALGKHSPLYREAEKFGIFEVVEESENEEENEELSCNLRYRCDRGMTASELDEMMASCTETCLEAHHQGLWFFLRYRENIHLYLSHWGLDAFRDYRIKSLKPSEEVF